MRSIETSFRRASDRRLCLIDVFNVAFRGENPKEDRMKSNLILCFVAAFGIVAANVQAQEVSSYSGTGDVSATVSSVADAAVAPATDSTQTTVQPTGDCPDCQECEGGWGVGFGRFRGGFGNFRDRMDQRAADRAKRIGNERQIVQASPFANPTGEAQDWARFRNYPYGYYPHNFGASDMRIPGYNPAWQNYYPTARRYHEGKHFNLDVF